MKKIRKHEGITLVALIITIVVLLILAVVAIGVVQDSKIIGHAQNAAGGYNETKKVEENTLSNYIQIIDLYLPQEEPQDVIASIKIGDLDELVYTHENGEKIGYNDTSIYLDRDKFKEKVGEEAYKKIYDKYAVLKGNLNVSTIKINEADIQAVNGLILLEDENAEKIIETIDDGLVMIFISDLPYYYEEGGPTFIVGYWDKKSSHLTYLPMSHEDFINTYKDVIISF